MEKTLEAFNREYLNYHVQKEEAFWSTYMGFNSDPKDLEKKDLAYKAYISSPERLDEVDKSLLGKLSTSEQTGLLGWKHFFETHSVRDAKARALQSEVMQQESEIFRKRAELTLEYENETNQKVAGSTNVLSTNLSASKSEKVRLSSHKALLKLEEWVVQNGFLDLVEKRNEFARSLGYPNYFAYKVKLNEGMSVGELFTILDEFEELTRDACFKYHKKLAQEKGADVLKGHNLKFAAGGDTEEMLNPYFPFERALELWAASFARLGISYEGAELTLDLFDRKGKFENGFMHGPGPSYFDNGRWQPARINFTSNANPSQVGSGRIAAYTLFHEGGHAAHFANVKMNSPCFSQEYPPTSMAYAETQSMFCDSLVGDADWMSLYLRDLNGKAPSLELLKKVVTSDQPFMAYEERSILVVPYFERALYEMTASERTPERVLALARECEKRILGIEVSPRPLLAIPHLLGGESACAYHGYLMAHMAVYQTREHFLKTYGALVDEPRIGKDLAEKYWACGNSKTHSETLLALTGSRLAGRALAAQCNETEEALWARSEVLIKKAQAKPQEPPRWEQLNAKVKIAHGVEVIATSEEGYPRMFQKFQAWVAQNFR